LDGKDKKAAAKADPSFRVIIFSRTTAMVTIPPDIRDKMMLVRAHERGHKVRVVFVPHKGYSGKEYPPKGRIEIRVEAAKPGRPKEKPNETGGKKGPGPAKQPKGQNKKSEKKADRYTA